MPPSPSSDYSGQLNELGLGPDSLRIVRLPACAWQWQVEEASAAQLAPDGRGRGWPLDFGAHGVPLVPFGKLSLAWRPQMLGHCLDTLAVAGSSQKACTSLREALQSDTWNPEAHVDFRLLPPLIQTVGLVRPEFHGTTLRHTQGRFLYGTASLRVYQYPKRSAEFRSPYGTKPTSVSRPRLTELSPVPFYLRQGE